MSNVRYVKENNKWTRVVYNDDIPEEYKSNHYYKSRNQSDSKRYSHTESDLEKRTRKRKNARAEEMKIKAERKVFWSSSLLGFGSIFLIALAITLIVLVSPSITAETVVEVIVGAMFKIFHFICHIFYKLCFALFDYIASVWPYR